MHSIPNLSTLQQAAQCIAPFIHRTPVLTCRGLDALSGARLFFKCENFQKVGAFKMRGATNAVLSLPEAEKQKGVATHSSGNHAQAVALAAKVNGIQAWIVMPETAPAVKKAAVLGYGAEVIMCKPTLQAREETLAQVVAQTGAHFIHPYNDYRVIAGQATASMELMEEVNELDVIMTPVGGGGLLSGTALAVHYLAPHISVIAGEPRGADDAWQSFTSGKLVPSLKPNTIADGLLTSLGEKTFGIIRQYVQDIIRVEEEEIKAAMRLVWERMKVIIEPSSAVPFAALLQQKQRFAGKKVGIIFSGGNVDLGKLPF